MRRERGMALPATLMVMLVVTMLGAIAVDAALHSLNRTHEDRRGTRAQAAADAGLSVASWRMNRVLGLRAGTSLTNDGARAIRELGCVTHDASGKLAMQILASAGWCPASPWHRVDEGERYRYWVSTAISLDGGVGNLIQRRIVVEGTDAGDRRRIVATFRLRVDPDRPMTAFELVKYAQCPSKGGALTAPDAGCPS